MRKITNNIIAGTGLPFLLLMLVILDLPSSRGFKFIFVSPASVLNFMNMLELNKEQVLKI